jgi:RNA polymerase sigma-70 factor (ECF subfamily)
VGNEPEWQLIRRLRAGEDSAFRQILKDHLAPLTRYAIRMTNSTSDAEEIVQETFVKFWLSKDQFNPERAKLTTWLHRIAHNLCIDHFRAAKPNDTEQNEATQSGPENNYHEDARASMLGATLMQLSEKQRSALVMCHYQGMRQNDAAIILEMSVDALESTLRRGRTKLRELLDDQGLTDET